MNWKELEQKRDLFEKEMKEKFPNLYKGLNVHWSEGGMIGGIDVGEGWWEIIKELSEKLEKEISNMENKPYVLQIKEKFGQLCFYMSAHYENLKTLIDEAEEKADRTCEYCGKENAYPSNYSHWIKTLCDECHEKRKKI